MGASAIKTSDALEQLEGLFEEGLADSYSVTLVNNTKVDMQIVKSGVELRVYFDAQKQIYCFDLLNNSGTKTYKDFASFKRFLGSYLHIHTVFIPNAKDVVELFTKSQRLNATYDSFTGNTKSGFIAKFKVLGNTNYILVAEELDNENILNVRYVNLDTSDNCTVLASQKYLKTEKGYITIMDITQYVSKLNDTYANDNTFTINRDGENLFTVTHKIVFTYSINIAEDKKIHYLVNTFGEYELDMPLDIVVEDFTDLTAVELRIIDFASEQGIDLFADIEGSVDLFDNNIESEDELDNVEEEVADSEEEIIEDEVSEEVEETLVEDTDEVIEDTSENTDEDFELIEDVTEPSEEEVSEADMTESSEIEETEELIEDSAEESNDNTESEVVADKVESVEDSSEDMDIFENNEDELTDTEVTEDEVLDLDEEDNTDESNEDIVAEETESEATEDTFDTDEVADASESVEEDFVADNVEETVEESEELNMEDITISRLKAEDELKGIIINTSDAIYIMGIDRAKEFKVPVKRIPTEEQIILKKGIEVTESEIKRDLFAEDITEDAEFCKKIIKVWFDSVK